MTANILQENILQHTINKTSCKTSRIRLYQRALFAVLTVCTLCVGLLGPTSQAEPKNAALSGESTDTAAGPKKSSETLNQELSSIDKKINATKSEVDKIRDSSYLVDLYFSLADLQSQKARLLYLIKVEKNSGKRIDEIDFTAERRPKQDAIDIYQKIVTFFPTSNRLDSALFLEALELRDLGQIELMIRKLSELAKQFPESDHFNEANIMIGDYFLEQKKDFDGAVDIFQKVVNRPLSSFTPIAEYRIGFCLINKMDNISAVHHFQAAVEDQQKLLTSGGYSVDSIKQLPETYRKTDIQREAILALITPFVEVYADASKPVPPDFADPIGYLKKVAPDHFTFRRAIAKLGRRLIVKTKYKEAADAFMYVLKLNTDYETKFDALQRINESRKRHESKIDLLDFVKEVATTVDLFQLKSASNYQWSAKLEKSLQTRGKNQASSKSSIGGNSEFQMWRQLAFLEALMRDAATQLQVRARASGSPPDFTQAAVAYEIYIDKFPVSPKMSEMKQNRAESLFKSGQWVEAGMLYEEVSHLKVAGLKGTDFSESAVEAYTHALQDTDKLKLIEKIRAREGLRASAADWIAANPKAPGASTAAFNIGYSWYQERNLKMAISSLGRFIQKYPRDAKVRDAIFLTINSYSQLDDNKGLESAGSRLLNTPGLGADDKQALADMIRKAQTKQLQALGGQFGSKEYVGNLLSVASKHKGSALGVNALYEAFVSMRSNRNPELFDVGDDLLEQHADSQYAKEVSSSLAQLALQTASYDRAGKYLAGFADRYPKDKESTGFRKTSAVLYERQGEFKIARDIYVKLNDAESVARMDFSLGDWVALERSSQAAGVSDGAYWRALAVWRQKRMADALPLVKQLASRRDIPRDQAGHANFLLIQLDLEKFKNIQMKKADDQAALVAKVQSFNALSKSLQQLIQSGAGKWPIAALYLLGQSDFDMARFISDSPVPAGLSKADSAAYIAALGDQAKVYSGEAKKAFAKCIDAAEQSNVFTRYVQGCRSAGQQLIKEDDDQKPAAKNQPQPQIPRIAAIRKELFVKGSDVNLLIELGDLYLRSGRSQIAYSIYARVLEIDSNNSRALASQGVAQLQLGQYDLAFATFIAAMEKNKTEPVAIFNLAGLYRYFQFNKSLAVLRPKLQGLKRPSATYTWPS